jgi:dipeptidyl aminopeptidase/acylaminoacyl peptidase
VESKDIAPVRVRSHSSDLACRAIALLLTILLPASGSAQRQRTPLSVEEVLSYRSLSENQDFPFSPDGKLIAYAVRDTRQQSSWNLEEFERTGVPQFAVGSSLWIADTQTGRNTQLSAQGVNDWNPAWSPDGGHVAYLSNRGTSRLATVWIHDMTTRKERQVSDTPVVGTYPPRWTPDGKVLLVETLRTRAETDKRPETDHARDSHDRISGLGLSPDVKVFVSDPENRAAARPGPWRIGQGQGNLALLNAETGDPDWVTRDKVVTASWISPDGGFVAYTVPDRFEREGSQQILFDLLIFERRTQETRALAKEIPLAHTGGPVTWAPDSKRLAYMEEGPAGLRDGFVVNVRTGEAWNVTSFGRIVPSPQIDQGLLWDASSEWLYFRSSWTVWRVRADGGAPSLLADIPNHRSDPIAMGNNQVWTPGGGNSIVTLTQDVNTRACGAFRVDLTTGEYTKLFEESRTYGSAYCEASGVTVSPNRGGLAFLSEDAEHEVEIWVSDGGFRNLRQLTHSNPQFEAHELGSARLIDWRDVDGKLLHGALLLPPGYRLSHRCPLLVWVYGSSLLSNRINTFGLIGRFAGLGFLHLFTTRGYAVLVPDAPLQVASPMLDIVKTVMPGVQKVVDLGIADPNRLGVIGHSFGGYTVVSLLVQTTRFKAAVISAGFADRMLMYGAMGVDGTAYNIPIEEASGSGGLGGTPWQQRSRYIENSPVYFLDRVETPVLLLHGAADQAVWPPAADELFVCLRRLGKTAEYARYERENHTPLAWSYAHQLDYVSRILTWFQKYLGPKS